MRKSISILGVSIMLLFGVISLPSCKKNPCKDKVCINGGACQDGTCICPAGYTGTNCQDGNGLGKVFFYVTHDAGWGKPTVTCNGESGILENYFYGTETVTCGQPGGITFEFEPGNYTYHLEWPNGNNHDGNVNVVAGGCTKEEYYMVPEVMGRVSFYNINPNYSNVRITVNGAVQYITNLTTNGQPSNCTQNGNANFELLPGTYTFDALTNSGATANGSFTISENGCLAYQLN